MQLPKPQVITRRLIIDPLAAAQAIEFELGAYLKPFENNENEPRGSLRNPGDWYDQYGRVVARPPHLPNSAWMPRNANHAQLPRTGIMMVGDMIAWTLAELAAWKDPVKAEPSDALITETFALPPARKAAEPMTLSTPLRGYFQTSVVPEQDYRNHQHLLERAVDLLKEVRTQVVTFVGDDVWVMHFYCMYDHDYVIEKTIDYRIHDWTLRMQSGEWS